MTPSIAMIEITSALYQLKKAMQRQTDATAAQLIHAAMDSLERAMKSLEEN